MLKSSWLPSSGKPFWKPRKQGVPSLSLRQGFSHRSPRSGDSTDFAVEICNEPRRYVEICGAFAHQIHLAFDGFSWKGPSTFGGAGVHYDRL